MTCSLTLTTDLEGDERKEGKKREEGRKKEGKWPWLLLPLSVCYNSLSCLNVFYTMHMFLCRYFLVYRLYVKVPEAHEHLDLC